MTVPCPRTPASSPPGCPRCSSATWRSSSSSTTPTTASRTPTSSSTPARSRRPAADPLADPSRVLPYQDAAEQRRQLAVEVGEHSQQLIDALCAAGWSAQQARQANVHQLAEPALAQPGGATVPGVIEAKLTANHFDSSRRRLRVPRPGRDGNALTCEIELDLQGRLTHAAHTRPPLRRRLPHARAARTATTRTRQDSRALSR